MSARTSDDVHVEAGDRSVEVGANHLLAVTGHHALPGGEVLRSEDRRGDDERNVGSVDIACLEVAAALVTDEDLVTGEVGVLVDGEAVAQGADRCSTDRHGATDLALAVDAVVGLVHDRSLEDRGDVGADHDEVGRTTEGLTVDLVGDVDDGLDESLVPLTDGASELGTGERGVGTSDLSGVRLVEEATRCTAPEVVSSTGLGEEVVEDLTVDLESDLLGEDLCELYLGVHRVIGVEVLGELW